jgi:hypothetical protein
MNVPLLAIPTTLVALVLIDQPMQLWIAVFLWYVAHDSLLNPPQKHLRFIVTHSWSTIYPQCHVVGWCFLGLILSLVKLVIDTAQSFTLEDHCLKEIVEFL